MGVCAIIMEFRLVAGLVITGLILIFYIGKDEVATSKNNKYSQKPGDLLIRNPIVKFSCGSPVE